MTTSYDEATTDAIRDAYTSALARAHHPDAAPADPVREDLAALQRSAPCVGTAVGLLDTVAARPVPLDPATLDPTAGPPSDLTAVRDHWRVRPADGVGVLAGVQPTGHTIFAVTGEAPALRAWAATVLTVPVDKLDDNGTVLDSRRMYRPGPAPVAVRWSPAPVQARSMAAAGRDAIVRMDEHFRGRSAETDHEPGWLAWTVAPQDDKRLSVASRSLGGGVSVVGTGAPIPWHVCRPNGWTLTAALLPVAPTDLPFPAWLAEAVGANWQAVR